MSKPVSPVSSAAHGAAGHPHGDGAHRAQAFPRGERTRVAPPALAEAFRLADALAIMLCVVFAFLRGHEGPLLKAPIDAIGPFFAAGLACAWLMAASKAYAWVRGLRRSLSDALAPAAAFGALGAFAGLAVAALLGAGPRLGAVAEGLWTGVFCLVGLHAVYWVIHARLCATGALRERLAIVGVTDTAARLIARANASGEAEIMGVFHDREVTDVRSVSGAPVTGDVVDLLAWPHLRHVDRVVVCLDPLERRRLAAVLARIIALPHPVALAMETPRLGDAAPAVTLIAGMPMALLAGAAGDARREAIKRLFDLTAAGFALAALSPALITCAAALRMERAGPVLQREQRYGRNNAGFAALRFRADTPVGALLRRLALDGMPLLINVAQGDMAVVGPEARPVGLLVDGVDPFTRLCDYAYRHRVKPGLTGLAQVNGLSGAQGDLPRFEAALALDLEYVRRHDLLLDLRIMLQALPALFGVRWRAG